MSLTVSLYSALAALQANQSAFQIASSNVANANTEGYTRKTVGQTNQIVNGESSGVKLTAVQRTVDENLLLQIRNQFSKLAGLDDKNTYYSRMQMLFGTLENNGDLSHAITDLGAALESLSTTPESQSARSDVVNQAIRLTNQLQFMSNEIQKMRQEADKQISSTVSRINDQLALINDLNGQISISRALGRPSVDLEDKRDTALNQLAKDIDIKYFTRDDGRVIVFTDGGRQLVENTTVTLVHTTVTLVHTSASQMSAELTYPNGIAPITIGAVDITAELRDGSLKALVGLRDTDLVNLQAEFDRLAEAMAAQVNAAHNDGTAFPPPTSLTGSTTVASTDAPSMTGIFRATVVDTNGLVVENLDVNLATLSPSTIGQLVTTLNAMTNATASINAQGKVVVTATGGNKIAINEMTSAVTTGSKTMGMGQFLGLNDFFSTGNGYSKYQTDRQASSTSALGLAGTLTVAYPGGSTAVAYNVGDSLTAIASAITTAMGAQNITATVIQEASGFRLNIADANGDNFYLTDSSTLTSTLNVRSGVPGIANRLAVSTLIANDPNQFAGGEVSGATTLGVGTVVVSAGNGATAQAIAGVFAGDLTLTAAGGLAATTVRLADYAANIMSVNATAAANISRDMEINGAYSQALTNQAASISQVNIDEEMSNIIILQNAYQAAARMTTAITEMMDILMNAVR